MKEMGYVASVKDFAGVAGLQIAHLLFLAVGGDCDRGLLQAAGCSSYMETGRRADTAFFPF